MTFKVIVCILGLIAIATGVNDFWRGAAVKGDFGELGVLVNDPTLNFTLRFLGGIWMGFGVLLIFFVTDLDRYKIALLISFGLVVIAGLGRVISIVKHGMTSGSEAMQYGILAVELLVVPALAIWLYMGYISD